MPYDRTPASLFLGTVATSEQGEGLETLTVSVKVPGPVAYSSVSVGLSKSGVCAESLYPYLSSQVIALVDRLGADLAEHVSGNQEEMCRKYGEMAARLVAGEDV